MQKWHRPRQQSSTMHVHRRLVPTPSEFGDQGRFAPCAASRWVICGLQYASAAPRDRRKADAGLVSEATLPPRRAARRRASARHAATSPSSPSASRHQRQHRQGTGVPPTTDGASAGRLQGWSAPSTQCSILMCPHPLSTCFGPMRPPKMSAIVRRRALVQVARPTPDVALPALDAPVVASLQDVPAASPALAALGSAVKRPWAVRLSRPLSLAAAAGGSFHAPSPCVRRPACHALTPTSHGGGGHACSSRLARCDTGR
jgi:hypothetical protein